MRILQIYDHGSISCGIMSVIMGWYKKLYKKDIQFDFLFSHNSNQSYENEIKKMGGHIYYMQESNNIESYVRFVKNVKKFMKEHSKDYDAIHLHTATFSYPYLYYAKKYNIRNRIVHVHSCELGNTKLSSIRNKLLIIPLRFLANYYIACSKEAGEKWFEKIGIYNYKILLNGLDFTKYEFEENSREEVRQLLKTDKNTLAVVHISNMNPIKNITFLIDVFCKILETNDNSKLFLVGKNELPKDVEKYIEDNNISKKVINLGIRKDVPKILQGMDICLMPSKKEGFGIVAIESQLSGIPTIVSKGFPKDIIVSNKIKMLELNVDDWKDTTFKMLREKKEKIKFNSKIKKVDLEQISKEIMDIYLSLN